MTAQDLLRTVSEQLTTQVTGVLDGLTADQWDARTVPEAMSPREVVAHLAEVYHAFVTETETGSYRWGTFRVEEDDPDALRAAMMAARERATEVAAGSDDPAVWVRFADYVIVHDSYHVGQLCTLRLALDPTWNPYGIYGA